MTGRMPEYMSDEMSENMSDRMPDRLPDRMPGGTSGYMPDRMPEYMPDRMSDRMSEYTKYMSKYTSWHVMVGITRSRVIWRWGKFFLRAKPTKCLIISPIRVAILWGIRHIGHMVRLYYPFLLECYGVESALQCRGSLYKGPADLAGHQNEQVDFPKMPSGVSKWGLRQVMAVWLRTYGYT